MQAPEVRVMPKASKTKTQNDSAQHDPPHTSFHALAEAGRRFYLRPFGRHPFAACGRGPGKGFGAGRFARAGPRPEDFAFSRGHHRSSAPRTGTAARSEKSAGAESLRAGTTARSRRSYQIGRAHV